MCRMDLSRHQGNIERRERERQRVTWDCTKKKRYSERDRTNVGGGKAAITQQKGVGKNDHISQKLNPTKYPYTRGVKEN